MWECKKCGEYRHSIVKECHCKIFTIIDEDQFEHEIHAMDKEDAAIKYAKTSNEENDYYLMDKTIVITIEETEFEIGAEPDVHYSVNEI
jgi:hypothetical protein